MEQATDKTKNAMKKQIRRIHSVFSHVRPSPFSFLKKFFRMSKGSDNTSQDKEFFKNIYIAYYTSKSGIWLVISRVA